MLLDKLLGLLIYPLGSSLLMGFGGLMLLAWGRRRLAKIAFSLSLSWLTLWSLLPVADAVIYSLERQSEHLPVNAHPQVDVILVFGGVMRSERSGHPYPDLGPAADRVWHAARLYHAGRAPKVILSGGNNDWENDLHSQARAMAQFLVDLGVPASDIVLEERSRNTYENARYCVDLMRMREMETAILVTSAMHMPRSLAVLRAQGVDAIPAATDFNHLGRPFSILTLFPNSEALHRSTLALHEWGGVVIYRWRGWM